MRWPGCREGQSADLMRSSGFRYPYRFTIDVLFRPVWRFTTGDLLADWKGDALIGGLVSSALIYIRLKGDTAEEVERFEWGERIREVEQGPDGALYVLEDGSGGRLLKLTPSR